ncbi:MAG: hypothetical protein SWO11_20010 [Thermodesulfobacteriota bacterium]|nr:hypothetical protein [Thermodesulfobacteriota bacterium]
MRKKKKSDFVHPLDKYDFKLPPEGLDEEKRRMLMGGYTDFIDKQQKNFMGYQANQSN